MATQTATKLLDDIELWDIDDLVPYANNPKQHPEDQIDRITASIKEYGWDVPIVADDEGVIIKGHGRHQAARRLGLTEVPVIVRDDLTDAEKKAARIADNKSAESPWADDVLATELDRLKEMDVDPMDAAVGFDEDELDDLAVGDEWDDNIDIDAFEDPVSAEQTSMTLDFADSSEYDRAVDWFDDVMTSHDLDSRADVIIHLADGGPL